jgi:thioredoxin reductase
MSNQQSTILDVAVIGGGPAGVSACLALSRVPNCNVALFESEREIGGIPLTCHVFFGLRDRKRLYTGPVYAKKLNSLVRATSTKIHLNTTVLKIIPGDSGGFHRIEVGSPKGFKAYNARTILLATGCYESPRDARMISGPRPAGIFTTGTLQQLVSRYHLKPGKRALIVGSETVALSCVLTLQRAGTTIVGLVEEDDEIQTSPWLANCMGVVLGFPIHAGTSVHAILGEKRVEGVKLLVKRKKRVLDVKCDCLILTGRFRAYSPLIDNTSIGYDPGTFGPIVDMSLMTSVPGIFAAGNVLRGAEMHDLCALEGKQAALNILRYLRTKSAKNDEYISIVAEHPIRYVVPQRIIPEETKSYRSSLIHPGPSIQVAHTVRKCALEAWSGSQVIWGKPFAKLIANTRIPLPLDKFNWQKANRLEGVVLKLVAL